MKVKRTPQELREQARLLLEKAKRLESERATRIGNLVLKHAEKGFEGFTLEMLKNEIGKI
jgi:hypothetical protein